MHPPAQNMKSAKAADSEEKQEELHVVADVIYNYTKYKARIHVHMIFYRSTQQFSAETISKLID